MAGCHRRRLGQRWNQRRLVALLVAPCTLTPQPILPRWDRPVGSRRRWGCFRQYKGSAWAASLQRSRQSRCTSEPHRQSRQGPWPRQRLAWEQRGAGGASSLFNLCGLASLLDRKDMQVEKPRVGYIREMNKRPPDVSNVYSKYSTENAINVKKARPPFQTLSCCCGFMIRFPNTDSIQIS